MRVLVIGGGAREHALCWALSRSSSVERLFCGPGNGGTELLAETVDLNPSDAEACATWAERHDIALTVVGPEGPLAAGIADTFAARQLPLFGPSAAAARIESSKGWAKDLLRAAGVPTARAQRLTSRADAEAFVRAVPANGFTFPLVVKADGLAAGKGVVIADDAAAAHQALDDFMVGDQVGAAGHAVVIEEYLHGSELSLFALTDGATVLPLAPACDYKRVGDGDSGPNTGGMGAYSPPTFATPALLDQIRTTILEPTIRALADAGCPFRGLLYAGLMITAQGPMVIEFNCRFGDPETQVLLPRLRSELLPFLAAVAAGQLAGMAAPIWALEPCVGVVLAAPGYPGAYPTGMPITGLEALDPDVLAFQAGTRRDAAGQLVCAGGRVLTLVARGATLADAHARVYANIARVRFAGAHWRTDIAARERA